MTDSRQFGGGKGRQFGDRICQFGDKPRGGPPGDSQQCAECEAMLTDALDGTLSATDQTRFDEHTTGCESCGQMVADARRGAAWLELLRNPAPEPPADLMERILAQTSWAEMPGNIAPAAMHPAAMASVPFGHALSGGTAIAPGSSNVIAFPRQTYAAVRRSGFGRIVLQPRLAMTAAMAFFSIALTLNITGIRLSSLRISDLQPNNLRRDFFSASARVVQYYEGLRVVYELESRVHDLQSAPDPDTDSPAGREAAPAGDSAPDQPATTMPNTAPSGNQPGSRQHEHSKGTVNPHTSRREDPMQSRSMVVAEMVHPGRTGSTLHGRMGRRLV